MHDGSILFMLLTFCMHAGGLFAAGAYLPLGSHLKKHDTDDLDGLWEKRYVRILTNFHKTDFSWPADIGTAPNIPSGKKLSMM